MHDVYDLKCKNILNIDEYDLQYPLISLFDRKNIDWGNLAQLFWPKTLFLAVFWYLDCVYCAQLPIYASPITYTSYFHMLYRIVFLYLFIFNQKIKKNSWFEPFFSVFRHMQDIHHLKCNNIIITDEYELQFHLISIFNRKDIDQGNLVRLFFGFFGSEKPK